jgi:hypothetical protein
MTCHHNSGGDDPSMGTQLEPVPLNTTLPMRARAEIMCAFASMRFIPPQGPAHGGVRITTLRGGGSAAAPPPPTPSHCLSTSHAFRLTPGRTWSIDTPSHLHTSMAGAEVPARTLPNYLPRLSPGRRGSHVLLALSA